MIGAAFKSHCGNIDPTINVEALFESIFNLEFFSKNDDESFFLNFMYCFDVQHLTIILLTLHIFY